jgi:hypothetical protein
MQGRRQVAELVRDGLWGVIMLSLRMTENMASTVADGKRPELRNTDKGYLKTTEDYSTLELSIVTRCKNVKCGGRPKPSERLLEYHQPCDCQICAPISLLPYHCVFYPCQWARHTFVTSSTAPSASPSTPYGHNINF